MAKFLKAALIVSVTLVFLFSSSFASLTVLDGDRDNDIVVKFQLSDYQLKSTIINGEKCDYFVLPDATYLEEKGMPAIPVVSGSIIIPNNARMALEIVDVQYQELVVNKLLPSKGVLFRNQIPSQIPYSFNEIYKQNTWFPQTHAKLDIPFIIRNIRGCVIHFQPVMYNPALGIAKLAESITVRVKRVGPGIHNVLNTPFQSMSPAFYEIYKKRFLNFQNNRNSYPAVADGDKMIVICAAKFMSTIEPFVKWKNQKGIVTTLHEYPGSIGSGATSIKSFIQRQYDENKITYILFVGDAEDIPISSDKSADPNNLLLAGGDKYPDAFCGRFSSSTVTDIKTMIGKVLKYEQKPDPNGDWYAKAMGIASNEGRPPDRDWMDDNRDVMLAYNYTEKDQIYDPSASKAKVSEGLNEGRGWVNYMGHGSTSSWGTTKFNTSDIKKLTNTDMLPVIISVACVNGKFKGRTCFAETWLNHGSAEAGKGAIVCLASSINQAWTPPQHAMKEMVKVLCEDKYISVGGIIYNGEMHMLEKGSDQGTFKSWNLFGDPSLLVFTAKPREMNVTHPQSIANGTKEVEIKVGKEVHGRVGFYTESDGLIGSKIIKGTSVKVPISLSANSRDNTVLLTVTARNCIPYSKEINIGPTSINDQNGIVHPDGLVNFGVSTQTTQGITFHLSAPTQVTAALKVFDKIGNLLYEVPETGFRSVDNRSYQREIGTWNLTNLSGRFVAEGIYLAVLQVEMPDGTVKPLKKYVRVK